MVIEWCYLFALVWLSGYNRITETPLWLKDEVYSLELSFQGANSVHDAFALLTQLPSQRPPPPHTITLQVRISPYELVGGWGGGDTNIQTITSSLQKKSLIYPICIIMCFENQRSQICEEGCEKCKAVQSASLYCKCKVCQLDYQWPSFPGTHWQLGLLDQKEVADAGDIRAGVTFTQIFLS